MIEKKFELIGARNSCFTEKNGEGLIDRRLRDLSRQLALFESEGTGTRLASHLMELNRQYSKDDQEKEDEIENDSSSHSVIVGMQGP